MVRTTFICCVFFSSSACYVHLMVLKRNDGWRISKKRAAFDARKKCQNYGTNLVTNGFYHWFHVVLMVPEESWVLLFVGSSGTLSEKKVLVIAMEYGS